MNTNSDYSLHSMLDVIKRKRKFIIMLITVALLLGVCCYFIFPKTYKAETVFILKDPQLADRNNLYNTDGKQILYFADEDDISRLISMAGSDSFQNKLISGLDLDKAYDFDIKDQEELLRLKKLISKKLVIYRAEDNNVVLLYSDKDAQRAAKVANYCVPLLEKSLRDFYNGVRSEVTIALQNKISEQDSLIEYFTDTLVKVREKYGIYDIINPARHNLMSAQLKDNGMAGFARGIEVVQNIESVKDELVASRATNITLLGQYTTGATMANQPLTDVILMAQPPVSPVLPLSVILVICFFAGGFFSILYVLAAHSFLK